MAGLLYNRSGELEVFVHLIKLGGFSASARAFGVAPSAVSELVARLEQRLALARLGLAHLAAFQVREDIAAGRLLPVLEDCNPSDLEKVHAVYLG